MNSSRTRTTSIRRLRVLCQKEKLRRENDLTRKHRAVTIYATWVLVRTRATADQVTVASIVTGLLGALGLAAPGLAAGLAGVALLYVSFALDQVDGEIARFRRRTSFRGVYLDELRHLLIYAAPVFALSFDVARGLGRSWPFAVGFVAALGLALARIEPRLPALIFGERALALLRRPFVGPVERGPAAAALLTASWGQAGSPALAAPPALAPTRRALAVAALRARLRAAVRAALRGAVGVYDTLAHQVLILLWIALAVGWDRGRGRPLGGVGLEGALLATFALVQSLALAAAVVSRARPGEVDRDVGERAVEFARAARGPELAPHESTPAERKIAA